MKAMIKKLKVNIISETVFTIQGHGVHTAYLELANALKKRADVIVNVNDKIASEVDITHIHTVGPFALMYLFFGKGKKVVTAHIVPYSLLGSMAGARLWHYLAKIYLKIFYNRADILFAVSDNTANRLKSLGIKKPIVVSYNSVDSSNYQPNIENKVASRKKLHISKDKFVVVGCGQVQPLKRFDAFVHVARSMPEAKFIWVGGMPFKKFGAGFKRMNRLVESAPKNLSVTGVLPREDVKDYLIASDVMFIPSIKETFGLALVEGAAAGLPIVARDIQDYDATFDNNIVRGHDGNFKQLIVQLREDKKFHAHSLKGSAAIAAKFDSKVVTEQVVEIYRDLLKLKN